MMVRTHAGRFTAVAASVVLATIGIGAVIAGVEGRSTVRDALGQEHVVGTPDMTPTAITAEAPTSTRSRWTAAD